MTPEQDEAENKRDRMANLHINSLTWKLVELIELSVAKNEIKVLASQLHEAMIRNVAANFIATEMGIPSVPEHVMSLGPQDYKGQPVNSRQGQPFVEWAHQSFTSIRPLSFLHGRKWDEMALAYVHALRPSQLRVIQGEEQTDAQTWRVTVNVDRDNNIEWIEQEVMVGLPEGVQHGGELDQIVRGM